MLTRVVIILLLLNVPVPDRIMKHLIARALADRTGARPHPDRQRSER